MASKLASLLRWRNAETPLRGGGREADSDLEALSRLACPAGDRPGFQLSSLPGARGDHGDWRLVVGVRGFEAPASQEAMHLV